MPNTSDLLRAIDKGDIDLVQQYISQGVNVNEVVEENNLSERTNTRGYTPVLLAAANGEFLILQNLVTAGASLEAKTHLGENVLFLSMINRHKKIVKWLIEEQYFRIVDEPFNILTFAHFLKENNSATEYIIKKFPLSSVGRTIDQTIDQKKILAYVTACLQDNNRPAEYIITLLNCLEKTTIGNVNFISQVIQDERWKVRLWAIQYLTQLDMNAHIPDVLLKGLQDSVVSVRIGAIESLEILLPRYEESPKLERALKDCLSDAESKVVFAAKKTLKALNIHFEIPAGLASSLDFMSTLTEEMKKPIHIIIVGEENVKRYFDYSRIPDVYEGHSVVVHAYRNKDKVTADSFGKINIALVAFNGSSPSTPTLAADIVNNIRLTASKPLPIVFLSDDGRGFELNKLLPIASFGPRLDDKLEDIIGLFRNVTIHLPKTALLCDKAITHQLKTGKLTDALDAVQFPKNIHLRPDGVPRIRITILGNTNEKADHVHRFRTKKYRIVETIIGADFFQQLVTFNGQPFSIEIWETTRDSRMESFDRQHLADAAGVIYCAPIEDVKSFNECVRRSRSAISSGTSLSLIGINLDQRSSNPSSSIALGQAIDVARKNNMLGYFECSAKTGQGIDEAFLGSFELIINQTGFFEWLGGSYDFQYSQANYVLRYANYVFQYSHAKPDDKAHLQSLLSVAQEGNLNRVKDLAEKKPFFLTLQDNDGNTAFLSAARKGHLDIVKYFVEVQNVSVAQRNDHGATALLISTYSGHLVVVQYLVEDGAVSLTEKDDKGNTALWLAADMGHLDIAKYLLQQGAPVNDPEDFTPLYRATQKQHADVAVLLAERGGHWGEKNRPPPTITSELAQAIKKAQSTRKERFEALIQQIERQEITEVDVAGDWLTPQQLSRLIQMMINNPHIDSCYLGQHLSVLLSDEMRYIQMRFRVLPLLTAKKYAAAGDMEQLLALTQHDAFYNIHGYTAWHIVAMVGNKTLAEKLLRDNTPGIAQLDRGGHSSAVLAERYQHFELAQILKNALKDQAFHMLKKQQLQSHTTVLHHLNYQLQLRQLLAGSTQASPLLSILTQLRALLHALYEQHLSTDPFNQLLQQCVYPSLLLDPIALEKALANQFSLGSRYAKTAKLFGPLNDLLKRLQQTKKRYLGEKSYEKICARLTLLIVYYEQFRERMRTAGEAKQPEEVRKLCQEPYLLSVLSQGNSELNPASTVALTPPLGEEEVTHGDVSFGTHIVRRSPDRKIHFKYHVNTMPCYPTFEYAVASFYNVVAQGQGVAPTDIVRLHRSNYQQVLIASLTVEGINLWNFLELHAKDHPEYLQRFEPYSFTSTIVTSILTRIGDGKADNYMVQFVPDASAANDPDTFLVKIVGIDNDIAFMPTVVRKRRYGQHQIQHYVAHKCIFYWFPQMQAPLDARFVDEFIYRDPIMIMLDWLQALSKRNRHYQSLEDEGIISATDVRSLQLPIKFKPNTVARLYHQLRDIQTFIAEQKMQGHQTTHAELLAHCYPEIAEYYTKLTIDDLPKDTTLAELLLYKQARLYSADAPSLEAAHIIKTGQSRALMSKVAISSAIQEEPERQQVLADAIAEFIAQVDFSEIRTEEGQRLILEHIKELKEITCLTIRNAAGLNDATLTELYEALPNLAQINLIVCRNVTSQGILQAVNTRKLQLSHAVTPRLSVLLCQQLSPEALYDFRHLAGCPLGFVGYSHNTKRYETLAYEDNATSCLHRLLMMDVTLSIGQLQLLQKLGADFNAQNETQTAFNGYRPLHYAAKQNNKKLIHRLIEFGADPKLTDAGQESPYKKAIKYGLFGAANALRNHIEVDPEEENMARQQVIVRIGRARLTMQQH